MSTELSGIYARDLTDTAGALHILKQRSGKTFSPDTLHYFVRTGKLSAYVFNNAELLRWKPDMKRHGQGLIFLKKDIYTLDISPKKRGRHAKNEISATYEISPQTS